MIRLATINDKDECLALAMQHINHVSKLTMSDTVDKECVSNLTDYVLTSPDSACFIYIHDNKIVGLLAGIVKSPSLTNERFFEEVLFVFKEGFGGHSIKLINVAKTFVEESKLDGMIMGCMSDAGERIFSLYNKLGLKDLERKYIWKPIQRK